MRENISINDSVIKYKGSEEKCLFWIFFYENRYPMTNLWLHDKIVCNNKSVRFITWGNAEKIPAYYMNIDFKRGCDHMNDLFRGCISTGIEFQETAICGRLTQSRG